MFLSNGYWKPDPATSLSKITTAVDHFKVTDGVVGNNPPLEFLKEDEVKILYSEDKLRVSLYKILLFVYMADTIKSGNMNLIHSYRYKAIQEYLIGKDSWATQRDILLANAGLKDFCNFNDKMETMKQLLNSKYETVNERFLKGENTHLKLGNSGKIKVSTPNIESSEEKYISSMLAQSGFTPISQVLSDINEVSNYVDIFRHFNVKNKKMSPKPETIFAGIIGKGCNIGVDKIVNISVDISKDVLANIVNGCFSLKTFKMLTTK